MMHNKSILTLALTAALTACGSSSDNTNSKMSAPALTEKMNLVTTTVKADGNICNYDAGRILSTEHFTIGVMDSGVTDDKFQAAAKVAEVAFNDLLIALDLDATTDLDITTEAPWTICVDSLAALNGSGDENSLDFSPTDDSNANYRLAKHELVHTIQMEVGDVNSGGYPERWFNEGLAHRLGSPASTFTSSQLVGFVETRSGNYDETEAIWSDPHNDAYSTIIGYLTDGLGLSNKDLLNVYINASNSSFETALNEALSSKSVTLYDLHNDNFIINTIAGGWLENFQAKGELTTNKFIIDAAINNRVDYLSGSPSLHFDYDDSSYEARLETVKDGTYKLYVMDDTKTVYGPMSVTIKDHAMGGIDLYDIAKCTDTFCSAD
ncbi:hypothetical protein CXF72_04550 [Psychromonas sp. MB-3u-54]|uniref:hypothetical protein n=1 Tax=Psychromonas sp. MB-3u-54 TaxID=2058319 RepID=UPI000C343286|nr:hypothetical protein [Psychromonas sp. MB-3u-54]PKH03775.1 hypothetical protein CXF72_04550 [Psychromonas sp. MB-3u-54]